MRRIAVVIALAALASCHPNQVNAGKNGAALNTSDLADLIEAKLKNQCVGYQFTISYMDQYASMRSWGKSRLSQDAPEMLMSPFDQYNIASVSKIITSAALVKLLNATSGVNLDSKMWTYLPSHWSVPASVKVITFRELLTHTSGFRSGAMSYGDLKTYVQGGIQAADHGVASYQNSNYSILRLIIPALKNYGNLTNIPASTPAGQLAAKEATQASVLADDYVDYVQKQLFQAAGLQIPDVKPKADNSALCYPYPANGAHGTDFGDQRLYAGASGWNLSSTQMSSFFRALHHTELMMPLSVSNKMISEALGYGVGTTTEGVGYYEKVGYLPGDLNSIIFGFDNGIIICILMNSPGPDMKGMLPGVFDAWYH